jgi:esterase
MKNKTHKPTVPKIDQSIPLNYKKYGTGKPLIILHGLFGSHKNWAKICVQLAQFHSVYALDLRNHGDSPHSDTFDFECMATDLNAFMIRMGIVKAIVLGHSMGGKVAMTFAQTHPAKVSKLIVVDIAPGSYGESQRSLIDALVELDLSTCSRQQDAHKALEPEIPSIEVRYFLLTNLVRDEHRNFIWKINLKTIAANFKKIMTGISPTHIFKEPTLFLKGEFSDFITSADLAMINNIFPLSKVKTIKGAGHWVHVDETETFVHMVREFSRAD